MGKRGLIKGIIVLVIVTTISFSCDGLFDDVGLSIYSGYYEIEVPIPPAEAGYQEYTHSILQTDLDEILEKEGQEGKNIKEIKVHELTLEVMDKSVAPDFNSVSYLCALINDGQLTDTIACGYDIPYGVSEIEMNVEKSNVKRYLDLDEYNITMNGELRETLSDTLWVKGMVKYEIILGFDGD